MKWMSIFALIPAFSVCNAQPGANLKGFVYDRAGFDPIPDAVVTVLGTRYQACTDLNGYFSLRVPEGKYVLDACYPGYKETCVEIDVNRQTPVFHKVKLDAVTLPAKREPAGRTR